MMIYNVQPMFTVNENYYVQFLHIAPLPYSQQQLNQRSYLKITRQVFFPTDKQHKADSAK